MKAEIAIIGGSGAYGPGLLKNKKEIDIDTKYGKPSDKIILGDFKGRKIAFLPRHAAKHTIHPSSLNNKANIWALKELGVTRILAPCAVGSLQDKMKPGDFVFVDQFIDRTNQRQSTFYDSNKVCHISMADPVCGELRQVLINAAKKLNLPYHPKGTYITVEGPRFSTRAESKLFRSWGADVIGMTLVPECVLAREAEICYASIAMISDYDCWNVKPVSIEDILKTMKENTHKIRSLLENVIPSIPTKRKCICKDALKDALI